MKFTCDREGFQSALGLAALAVAGRSPRPQLTCVHIIATKANGVSSVRLEGMDGEISLRLDFARVEVETPGRALIPAAKLSQIVSAQTDPTFTMEAEGAFLHVRGTDAHFKVYGYPPADFPPIETPGEAKFSVPADLIMKAVRSTIYATAKEHTRYAINGVLLLREGKTLEAVATDGRRLAIYTRDGSHFAGKFNVLVPTKALSTLIKLLDQPDEMVHISSDGYDGTQMAMAIGDVNAPRAVLTTSLIEGAFPPYRDVLPKENDIIITFNVAKFNAAIQKAALLTNEESRGVRFAFKKGSDRVEITSRAPEQGEAEVGCGIESAKGLTSDLEIGFNPAFLRDVLRVVDGETVEFHLKAPNKPGLFVSGPQRCVVMPVALT